VSRLDSFIRRMEAQRACLDWAAAAIAGQPGCVLELGLGNGRTYDHLRERLPDRAIYVFDRRIAAHAGCIPPEDRLYLGEVSETLPRAAAALGPSAVLVHSDLGIADDAANAALAAEVAPLLAPLLAPGGLVVANHPYRVSGWRDVPLPAGVSRGRYFLYQATGPVPAHSG
jgi:hypothetical protein